MSLAEFSASVSFGAPALFIGPQSTLIQAPTINIAPFGHDVFFGTQGIPFQCTFDNQGAFTGVTASGFTYSEIVVANIISGIVATMSNGQSVGPIYYGRSREDASLKTISNSNMVWNRYILSNVDRNTIGGWILHLFTNFIDYQLWTNAAASYTTMNKKPSSDWISSDQTAALTAMFNSQLTATLSSKEFNQKILTAMLLAMQFQFDGNSTSVQYFKPSSTFPAVTVQMNINVTYGYTLNGASNRTVSIVCPTQFSIIPGTFQDVLPASITLGSMSFSRMYGITVDRSYNVAPANAVSASFQVSFPSMTPGPRYILLDQLPYIECGYLAVTLYYQSPFGYSNLKIFETSNSNTHVLNRLPVLAFECNILNVTLTFMEVTIWNPSFNVANDLFIPAIQRTLVYTMM